jgi:hypothetical protein
MSKFTQRLKKIKNKSKRGGKYGEIKRSYEINSDSHREGIIDKYENKLSEAASNVKNMALDTGLKMIGLERIQGNVNEKKEDHISKTESTLDKAGSVILGNINEVLGSDVVKQTTEQAAQDTAEIIKTGANKFNQALDDPEVKAEITEAIKNAGELTSIIVEAGKEPFNEVVDIASEATQKATSAALSGAVKVGTDVLAAVPFFGAIVDLGKMVNDGSKAVSAITEAGTEAVEAASDAFIETKKNIETRLRELEEKKKISQQISNRTTNSINEFENPTTAVQSAGGYKTRRRLFKRKAKSKRVRFAI